ncbi:MAG TPA: type III-B CRISPR module-associated protein Cmr5 [Gemmataceae bacterium]|nr:type III-B CRISPR module-associated protein Cmr5 [Gemmataceae bacterium]
MTAPTQKKLPQMKPAETKPPETKTLDQLRAKHAWDRIQEVVRVGFEDKNGKKVLTKEGKEFGTQVKKLPTRIIAAGLGQALAFLEAKESAPALHRALTDWIEQRRPADGGEDRTLLIRLIRGNADFQRYATAECLAYLVWLVRFADACKLTDSVQEG